MGDFGSYELDKVKNDTVPKGEYPVIISKMEKKPTKSGNGERIALSLQIVSGQFQNRTIFDGLNVKNGNSIAQNIGRQQLKKLLKAAGFSEAADPSIDDVVNKVMKNPVLAVVDVKDDQNVVKGYKARVVPTTAAPAAKEPNMIEQAFEGSEPTPKKNPFA